ncbi:hypothetical protein [Lysinibacillus sp. BPa_S21]|uniref:hypothetical protein n=1 Tax=Lysinibacillus sp. BPa_S21 TaxID=2932478 RepID=UPI00201190F4|nr:hypothetical protein [Lysinibacillus sp. BPa_S21]MCL1696351.1 hypothetical protein [Lysinibacillus sp. BPa_S21]
MLIIETNISYNDHKEIEDHQSRIIEANSWEEYILTYQNNKPQNYNGTMCGYNFSRFGKILNLSYDDFHLSCDIYNPITITKKMAYRLENEYELNHIIGGSIK